MTCELDIDALLARVDNHHRSEAHVPPCLIDDLAAAVRDLQRRLDARARDMGIFTQATLSRIKKLEIEVLAAHNLRRVEPDEDEDVLAKIIDEARSYEDVLDDPSDAARFAAFVIEVINS